MNIIIYVIVYFIIILLFIIIFYEVIGNLWLIISEFFFIDLNWKLFKSLYLKLNKIQLNHVFKVEYGLCLLNEPSY